LKQLEHLKLFHPCQIRDHSVAVHLRMEKEPWDGDFPFQRSVELLLKRIAGTWHTLLDKQPHLHIALEQKQKAEQN